MGQEKGTENCGNEKTCIVKSNIGHYKNEPEISIPCKDEVIKIQSFNQFFSTRICLIQICYMHTSQQSFPMAINVKKNTQHIQPIFEHHLCEHIGPDQKNAAANAKRTTQVTAS